MKKKVSLFIICITVLLPLIIFRDTVLSYSDGKPDIETFVSGSQMEGGAMFDGSSVPGTGLWMPGMSASGTLRINNNYSNRVRINSLGLHLTLERLEGQEYKVVSDKTIYEKFAKYLKLTIKKGRYLVFTDEIYKQSFFEMLYTESSYDYKGYTLPVMDSFAINGNDLADLEYTIKMDETAGNDMQGLRAKVDFIVNVNEYPQNTTTEMDDDDDNGQLVKAPTISIPDEGVIDYAKKYPDIKGHWAYESIVELIKQGVVTGYEDGSIRPDNYITRLEAAILIARTMGLKGSQGPTPYKDNIPVWAKGYVTELHEKGIMIGVDHDKFSPGTTITREEMATILSRLYKLNSEEENYVALEDLGGWSERYIRAVVKNNIMLSLEITKFKPKQKMKRAEIMDFIYKAINQMSISKLEVKQ